MVLKFFGLVVVLSIHRAKPYRMSDLDMDAARAYCKHLERERVNTSRYGLYKEGFFDGCFHASGLALRKKTHENETVENTYYFN